MKKSVFIILIAIFVVIVWEVGCLIALWGLDRLKGIQYVALSPNELGDNQLQLIERLINGELRYIDHDPMLGWKIKANGTSELYQANSQGIRADREYSEIPGANRIRVSSFGDSFTHGDEVVNAATWQVQWESLDPSYEVINFGVGGYGPDQSYLRYLTQGRHFHSEFVLIGFMSENIFRVVNTFRPFYAEHSGLPLSKPRFVLSNEELTALPNPLDVLEGYKTLLREPVPTLATLGSHDWFYQHRYRQSTLDVFSSVRLAKLLRYEALAKQEFGYQTRSEAFQLSLEISTRFYRNVEGDHSIPVITLFPNKADLVAVTRGDLPGYTSFKAALEERQMRVFDIAGAFPCRQPDAGVQAYFEAGGHYSKEANKLIAQYIKALIDRYIREHEWPMMPAHPCGESGS